MTSPILPSTKDQQKQAAGQAALQFVTPGKVLGVGSGSTVNAFISQLVPLAPSLPGAVAASESSAAALRTIGIKVLDLNAVDHLSVYVDGADEIDPSFALIKGGGAALTREKIIATAADTFICMVDASKTVSVLGKFPLPLEVIPMASGQISQWLRRNGGEPRIREGVVTDNGNLIIDVSGLSLTDPDAWERELNQLPGMVSNGIFAQRRADVRILASESGVLTTKR